MENLRVIFLGVSIILALLAMLPPLPHHDALLAGALAFLAAGHLV